MSPLNKMQTLMNGYERRLALGPSGGTKDTAGKYTQADIKTMLGTLSIQLEIDIRILRYIGHITRLPTDRWEYRVLFGRMRGSSNSIKSEGKDNSWEHSRGLIKEAMDVAYTVQSEVEREENLPWYELAKNRVRWRSSIYEWKERRTRKEPEDTQKP